VSSEAEPRARLLTGHLFDAAALLSQLVFFDALVTSWQTVWVRSFFWVYLAFCGGLALKRYDPAYVAGMAVMWKRHGALTTFGVYIGGTCLGALAMASLAEAAYGGRRLADLGPLLGIPLALLVTFAAPVLHAWAMHRARRHPRPAPRPAVALTLKLLSSAAIFALTLYLLAFVYRTILEARGTGVHGLGWQAALLFVATTTLTLFYFPGRIHTLIEAPEERVNWVSFGITCLAAALFAVAGLHVGF
jgi:predicted transporter